MILDLESRRPSAVAQDVSALTRQGAQENPPCGAPRIHGELLRLGVLATVAKYLRHPAPPSSRDRRSPRNHVKQIVAADRLSLGTEFSVVFARELFAGSSKRFAYGRGPLLIAVADRQTTTVRFVIPHESAPPLRRRARVRRTAGSAGSASRSGAASLTVRQRSRSSPLVRFPVAIAAMSRRRSVGTRGRPRGRDFHGQNN